MRRNQFSKNLRKKVSGQKKKNNNNNSESQRQERIGDVLKSLCVCVVGVQGVIKFLCGDLERRYRSSLVGFICCGKGLSTKSSGKIQKGF